MIDFISGFLGSMFGGLLGGKATQRGQRAKAEKRLAELREGGQARIPCAMRRAGQTQWRHGDLLLTVDRAEWTPPTMPSGTLLTGRLSIDHLRPVTAKEAWSINPSYQVIVGHLAGSPVELAVPADDWPTAALALAATLAAAGLSPRNSDELMPFEEAKRQIMESVVPSADDNLLGMRIDFDAYLDMRCPALAQIDVRSTIDPANLLVADCTARPGASPNSVAEQIEAVWVNDLSYRYRECHRLRQAATTVELDFVTQIGDGDDDFFVTGTIMVRWPEAEGLDR